MTRRALAVTAAVAVLLSAALAGGVYVERQTITDVCDAQANPAVEYAFLVGGDPHDIVLLVERDHAIVGWLHDPPQRLGTGETIGHWNQSGPDGYRVQLNGAAGRINTTESVLEPIGDGPPPEDLVDCVGDTRPRGDAGWMVNDIEVSR